MRCDQFAGLPLAATEFLREHEIVPEPCPTCHRPHPPQLDAVGSFSGMFDDVYSLHRHYLKDGRTADEFLQAAPWSSGPVHFIGLQVSSGETFVHSDEDISNA
jgi:hypothetical protein